MHQITFCIEHVNRLRCTKRCLNTIFYTTKVPYKIFLLIQGSNPNVDENAFFESLQNNPDYTLFFSSRNLGCPGGRQFLLSQKFMSPYIMVLDNDVYLQDGWNQEVSRAFENPEVKTVGFPLYDRESKIVGGRGGIYKLENNIFNITQNSNFQDRFVEVDTLSEGCMIFRSEMKKYMFWDDKYEQSYSGHNMFLNFNRECKKHGWKIILATKAKAEHWQHKNVGYKALRMNYPQLSRDYARFRMKTGYHLPFKKHVYLKYVCPLLKKPIADFLRWVRRKPPLIWMWKPKVL